MENSGDIRCNLRRLIKEKEIAESREITYEIIREATGITTSALSALVNDKTRRYDAHVLARLCWYFGCTIGNLLEYVPPAQEESPVPDDASITVATN
jgi:putative transcriptional regulator